MKKIISLTLVVLLMQLSFVHSTYAGTKEEKLAEKLKTEISKLGTGSGAKIKIKLKDGIKIKGYVTEVSENGFVVMNSETNKTVPVSYSQVKQAKGNNLSSGVIILIGVGVAIAFIIFAASQLK